VIPAGLGFPTFPVNINMTQHDLFQKKLTNKYTKNQRLTPEIGNSWKFQETLFKVGNALLLW